MKKRKDKIKETPKIRQKRTRESAINKQTNQKELNPWEEIRLKLQPLSKAYRIFREKRKIVKQKEEQRKLKETKIKEDQEEREKQAQIYKERMAKAERARLIQLEEATELKEKRSKEKKVYDEYQEKREISEPKEKERKLIEERNLNRERKLEKKQKLKEKETQRLKEEDKQKLKEEEEQRSKEGEIRFDEQNKKRLKGKVKWFSGAKGYGFIEREDKEKDIFVHFSAVKNSGLKYLKEDEQLTFEVEYSDKGPSAINLQKTVNEVSRSHLRVVK